MTGRRIGPIISLALVVAVASALWWLDTLRREAPVETADPAARHAPEIYFAEFRVHAYDAVGAPRHVLTGDRMTRYTDDESSEIDRPTLFFRDPVGPPWYVVSRRGTLDAEGDRLELTGRVVATRSPDSPDLLVMRTPRLTVLTAAGRAETAAEVDIVGTGSRVHSTGMTATFETGLVELHEDVRGRHDSAITP